MKKIKTVKMKRHELDQVKKAKETGTFIGDGSRPAFQYLFDNFFCRKRTKEYCYFWPEKQKMVRTGLYLGQGFKEKDLREWRRIFRNEHN